MLVKPLLADPRSELFRALVPSARLFTAENILANLFDLTAGEEGAYPRPGDAEKQQQLERNRRAALQAQAERIRKQAEGAT